MGKLANYGPGEIFDRLSILALKVAAGIRKERSIAHFLREAIVLAQQLPAVLDPYAALRGTLATINQQLWEAEDDLRDWRRTTPDAGACSDGSLSIAKLAFRIQELNDERAKTIAEINRMAGRKDGEEKI